MKNYFASCNTLDELKKAYHKAAIENHPDCGGDTATMQRINQDYEIRFEELKANQNAKAAADTTGKTRPTTEAPADFINIISILLNLEGLEVELCGRWLWIGGNTLAHKEALKAAGCRWCNNKKLWSWHYAEDGDFRSRGKRTMQQIRNKYGSTVFSNNYQAPEALTA